MTPLDQPPDVATLVAQVIPHLPSDAAERIGALPPDDLDTLGEAYIDLVALDSEAPVDLVAEVEAVLGAASDPGPDDGPAPAVVTY